MKWYNLQKTKEKIIDIPELKIQTSKLTGESKRKVFVLYKDVLDKFMENTRKPSLLVSVVAHGKIQ
ncbi:hypothetical protein [Tepidibacter formicigenes]|jgi:hypothetical protein|uniref:Uncharacterized protein n=1 Tax=Tepidibacter formicigenes DSM 15518 TaxID=1123349 RepID=A0A1M6U1C9_9FIRM|nr:hypothetical protein [Tepidibacter formicigenes]SHK62953.1 hypothetical protein SAMN02744037_02718 [Tepidibacter formicigenes DSM 15518]